MKKNDDLIVLATCTRGIKRHIPAVIVNFLVGLIASILLIVFLFDKGISYYIPLMSLINVFLLYVVIVHIAIPRESITFDKEENKFYLYVTGTIFSWIRRKEVKLDDLLGISVQIVNRRHFGIRFVTAKKSYVSSYVDDHDETMKKIGSLLPDKFFIAEYIKTHNFDKILTLDDQAYYFSMYKILQEANYTHNVSKEFLDCYMYLYFINLIEINDSSRLNYFILYFSEYLDNVIRMFTELGFTDAADIISRLYFMIPQAKGIEYYEEYREGLRSLEQIELFTKKLEDINKDLIELNKDHIFVKRFREYFDDEKLEKLKAIFN